MPTKILSLINSFKGTATSKEIADAISKNFLKLDLIKAIPISDGGDGFIDCFVKDSKKISIKTVGPFTNMTVHSKYLIKNDEAFIEIADICGIKYLKKEQLDPLNATTYGIGKVVKDAIKKGAKKIYFGLGGTASNDAGCGLAYSLGIKFLDKNKKELFPNINGILNTKFLDFSCLKIPQEIKFYALYDVKNKLLGPKGSAYTFGRQKGAGPKEIRIIEKALKNLSKIIKKETKRDISTIEGGASAGGLCAGLYGFFNAERLFGSKFIIEKLNIENEIKKHKIIITGEGKFDKTSFYGKITGEIIKLAKKYQKRCIVITAINELKPKHFEIIELSKIYDIEEVIKNPIKFILKEISKMINLHR